MGMPSVSPSSSLGFGNAVGKGRTFLHFQFTINNKCLIGRIHKSKFADSVLNIKPWHENSIPPIALGAAALVLLSGAMSPPKLSSGRGIGKVTPILYILKCHPLKSDVPSIRWLLIFFSCLVLDVLFLFFPYTISSSQFHNISRNSRPFFISHNFGLGLFSFFGGSLLIQLRPLSLPVHSTAVESDSINLWPKPVVVWLLRGRDCAIITLVILANYESIMWHRSAYPIISQLRLSVSHKLVVKGQAR